MTHQEEGAQPANPMDEYPERFAEVGKELERVARLGAVATAAEASMEGAERSLEAARTHLHQARTVLNEATVLKEEQERRTSAIFWEVFEDVNATPESQLDGVGLYLHLKAGTQPALKAPRGYALGLEGESKDDFDRFRMLYQRAEVLVIKNGYTAEDPQLGELLVSDGAPVLQRRKPYGVAEVLISDSRNQSQSSDDAEEPSRGFGVEGLSKKIAVGIPAITEFITNEYEPQSIRDAVRMRRVISELGLEDDCQMAVEAIDAKITEEAVFVLGLSEDQRQRLLMDTEAYASLRVVMNDALFEKHATEITLKVAECVVQNAYHADELVGVMALLKQKDKDLSDKVSIEDLYHTKQQLLEVHYERPADQGTA